MVDIGSHFPVWCRRGQTNGVYRMSLDDALGTNEILRLPGESRETCTQVMPRCVAKIAKEYIFRLSSLEALSALQMTIIVVRG